MGGIIHDFNRENELERIEKLKKKALQLEEEERSKTKKAASDLERQQPLERIEESERINCRSRKKKKKRKKIQIKHICSGSKDILAVGIAIARRRARLYRLILRDKNS